MSEEEFRKIAKEYAEMYFTKGINSTKIFYYVDELEKKVEQLENIRKEAIEYVTSYESISTIQGLDAIEKNKILDEKTMNEMVNRYLKVHDNLLNILNKGDNNVKDKR